MLKRFLVLAFFFCSVVPAAQEQNAPINVSYCDLATTPKSYDGKTIRVRGTLSVNFEDFSLFDRSCKSDQGIWLTFGGDVPGVVASTMNDTERTPEKDITVEGKTYAIQKDDSFRRLYALITARNGDKPLYSVTATLTGAFFAGDPRQGSDGVTRYFGYGHLECCSLFVITGASEVNSTPPANLNLNGVVLAPNGKPAQGILVLNDSNGGTPPVHQPTVTDAKGQFHFSDAGQIIRVEMSQYRPVAEVVSPGGKPVKITLVGAGASDWRVPVCRETDSAKTRIGFKALVSLPPTMASEYYNDKNSSAYFIFPKGSSAPEAELVIGHYSQDVGTTGAGRNSRWFSQRWIKDASGNVIGIDARGRSRDGIYYRSATFGGHDTIGYSMHLKSENPTALNRIIDGVCTAPN